MIECGGFEIKGDAQRTVDAMIAAGDDDHPGRRVALGSAAFENIERTLAGRLDELRAQRAVAYMADKA